ncbi:restriction endonuclease [Hydrocarboniphaga effusa]|uniref:restriction endonuclease n=1 Tax=Hydrocarboniphaga effusa TaxID=243629 RepID=UPI000A2F1558
MDAYSGTRRERVIVQCKHWRSRSVSVPDLAVVKTQMQLWEPPRIDALVIATSGRFTADAVKWIERHNQSDSALKIHMWAESHLEMLLASRPNLIAEFRLR